MGTNANYEGTVTQVTASWCHLLTRSIQAALLPFERKVEVVDGKMLICNPDGAGPIDGKWNCSIFAAPHSWLLTSDKAIIDVNPLASVGGPVMFYTQKDNPWKAYSKMYQEGDIDMDQILNDPVFVKALPILTNAFETAFAEIGPKDMAPHYVAIDKAPASR